MAFGTTPGKVAAITPASTPAVSPNSRRPTRQVSRQTPTAKAQDQNLAPYTETPKSLKSSATSQNMSGGLRA